jgi:hypothetical protein
MVGFTLRFSPNDARTYEALIPVFLDDNKKTPYLHIEVLGVGQYPRCALCCGVRALRACGIEPGT